jgi:hypothetical protein
LVPRRDSGANAGRFPAGNGILAGENGAVRFQRLLFQLEFMFSRIHKSLVLTRAPLRAGLVFCFVLGVAGWANAAGTSTRQSPVMAAGFNSNFAIADFDGDRKPDLATVEVQKGNSSSATQYSIRLQLTAGGVQVFGVIAPAGGLQIVARDVNGDDALDVLVSTAWQHKQVAVLLNDGHGKFALADVGAFPAALGGSRGDWTSERPALCDSTVLVRIEYPPGELDRESEFDGPRVHFERTRASVPAGSTRIFLFSLLGRAPPTFTPAS